MKVYYFNDTYYKQTIYVNDLMNPVVVLNPAMGGVFEIKDCENSIPFIKVWENGMVLISTITTITSPNTEN